MIHDMQKFLFIGVPSDLDKFFETAQKRGFIEFISPSGRKPVQMPQEAQDLQNALKILKKEGPARDADFVSEIEPNDVAKRVIQLKREEEAFVEEMRLLRTEISQVAPLGEFSVDDIKKIESETGKKVQFFSMRQGRVVEDEEMIYLTTEHDFDYYMAMTENGMTHRAGWIELVIAAPLSELKHKLEIADLAMHKRHEELLSLTPYIQYLSDALRESLSDYYLAFAKEEVISHMDGALFSVEAWVPQPMLKKVQMLLRGMAIHAEEIAIEKEDRIPTAMENKGLNSSGEDLVHIYDTPAHTDRDPSGWVLWFFTFFFGVIVSDGGYGALYFIIAMILRVKTKQAGESMKRVVRLLTMLSISCMVWGVVTASYFGLDLKMENPLQKVSVLHYLVLKKTAYHIAQKDDVYDGWVQKFPQLANVTDPQQFLEDGKVMREGEPVYEILVEYNDNILMEIALLIGVIHLILSLLRYCLRTVSSFGWIFFLVGGYMFCPKLLNATSIFHFMGVYSKGVGYHLGELLAYGGVGFAFLAALIQERLPGLAEPTKAIQLFADTLSYLRLYALGLAGMMMAATFNQMGKDFGLLRGGILIVIAGHMVNIGVGIMGGVIHGLRLNFLEWYHYCFEGDGKRFNPLRIMK